MKKERFTHCPVVRVPVDSLDVMYEVRVPKEYKGKLEWVNISVCYTHPDTGQEIPVWGGIRAAYQVIFDNIIDMPCFIVREDSSLDELVYATITLE